MMNTKITSMLLAMVMALGLFAPQGSWASEKEEETYILPGIKAVVNKFPGKLEYKLISNMQIGKIFTKEDDVEWVDDSKILARAKEIKPRKHYNHNLQLDYLSEYIVQNTGRKDFGFDDFGSRGMEKVFYPAEYENLTTPSPGDIAWEGHRPWSEGYVVDNYNPDSGKVVVYGWDCYGNYVAYRANADRFYYFRVKNNTVLSSEMTRDNYALMIRRSRRPLMVGHNGYFYPDRLVTRAEFAQILVNLFELDPSRVTETSFSDVKPTDWFAPAVEAAKKAGLINGTPEGKFLPQQHVTYEQVAVMLANYWKQTGLYQKRHNPAIFLEDVPEFVLPASLKQSYAKEEVEFAVRLGVLPYNYKVDGKRYHYNQAVPRKEMAEILFVIADRQDIAKEDEAKVLPFKDWDNKVFLDITIPISE